MRAGGAAGVALVAASALCTVACSPLSTEEIEVALNDFDTAVDRRDWDGAKRLFASNAEVVVLRLQSESPEAERIRSDDLIDRQAKALEGIAAYERNAGEYQVRVEPGGSHAAVSRRVEESFVLPDGRTGKVVSEEAIRFARHAEGIRIVSLYLRIKSAPIPDP